MQSGNIIKLTEQYNIHKPGTLAVIVNSQNLKNPDQPREAAYILFEDGHFISLMDGVPFQNIGYNKLFDVSSSHFKALRQKVQEQGKKAFIPGKHCSDISVILTDDAERKTYFSVGFDVDGNYFQTESTFEGDEIGTHTVNAFIDVACLDIDGNGWRDIESGDYMEDFISDVIYGDRDASEFLVNIFEALDANGQPGVVY